MKKIILSTFILLYSICNTFAQSSETITTFSIPAETPGTNRVYAELLGYGTNVLGLNKNVTVSVDLGQFQSMFKPYTLLDENGKTIKFNSMVAAMNYMGERGWKFVQAYVITESPKNHVYHWLMYKDVVNSSEIYDGLRVSNTESDPKHQNKTEKPKKVKDKEKDDIYCD